MTTTTYLEALILSTNQVLDWHLDILKRNVGRSTAPRSRALHLARRDAGHRALEQQQRDAAHAVAARAHGGRKEVGEHAIGDPLLLAVDNVVLAVGRLDGGRAEVGDVATGARLGDGEADNLLAAQTRPGDAVAQRLRRKVQHRRQANVEAGAHAPADAGRAAARELLENDLLVEGVELLGLDAAHDVRADVLGRPRAADHAREPAGGVRLGRQARGQRVLLLPLVAVRHHLALDPLLHRSLEAAVRVLVVRRVPAEQPRVLGVRQRAGALGQALGNHGRSRWSGGRSSHRRRWSGRSSARRSDISDVQAWAILVQHLHNSSSAHRTHVLHSRCTHTHTRRARRRSRGR